jgi:hypothetical protein
METSASDFRNTSPLPYAGVTETCVLLHQPQSGAEEIDHRAAVFFARHNLDERNAPPGEDDALDARRKIWDILAITFAHIRHFDEHISGLRFLFDICQNRVFTGNVQNDGSCHRVLLSSLAMMNLQTQQQCATHNLIAGLHRRCAHRFDLPTVDERAVGAAEVFHPIRPVTIRENRMAA